MDSIEAETAKLLRGLLAELDSGRLDAPGRTGDRLRRRMEGAATALELAGRGEARQPKPPGPKTAPRRSQPSA